MWQVHRRAQLIVASAAMLTTIGLASAQEATSSVNNSFQLPGVSLPSGSDEVRAADGTSCRSAIGNGGAYLDVGVIGNPNGLTGSGSGSSSANASAYGRIVIPLGRARQRVDCTRLYDLEVRRLEVELKLMEMGIGRPVQGAADTSDTSSTGNDEFTDDGWSTDGLGEG